MQITLVYPIGKLSDMRHGGRAGRFLTGVAAITLLGAHLAPAAVASGKRPAQAGSVARECMVTEDNVNYRPLTNCYSVSSPWVLLEHFLQTEGWSIYCPEHRPYNFAQSEFTLRDAYRFEKSSSLVTNPSTIGTFVSFMGGEGNPGKEDRWSTNFDTATPQWFSFAIGCTDNSWFRVGDEGGIRRALRRPTGPDTAAAEYRASEFTDRYEHDDVVEVVHEQPVARRGETVKKTSCPAGTKLRSASESIGYYSKAPPPRDTMRIEEERDGNQVVVRVRHPGTVKAGTVGVQTQLVCLSQR